MFRVPEEALGCLGFLGFFLEVNHGNSLDI